MDIQQAIYQRRAVRQYTDEPVNEGVLRELIDAAIQAPSAMNEQPWLFSVVRDKAVLSRISCDGKAATAAMLMAKDPNSPYIAKLQNPDFDILYNAPAMIVIASASDGPWAPVNCSLAAQNLMLAARASGLATCWIGLAQAFIASAEGKALLGLPADCAVVAGIVVGHTTNFPPPIPRQDAKITWI
jgi:nitroreductase